MFLGQTVNSYHDGTHDFADLLRATDAVDGLLRIRYTSPHPSDMSERVIVAMAECAKVMPHVHLPLQSASDSVLEAMNRTYTMAGYRRVVARLRAAIPELALSTDIIVGFPGETEATSRRTVGLHARGPLRQRVPVQVLGAPRHQGLALARDGERGGEGRGGSKR